MRICPNCRLLLQEIIIFTLVGYTILVSYNIPWPIVLIIAVLPVYISFGTITILSEAFTLIVATALFTIFSENNFALYLPFITWALLLLSVRSGRQWAAGLSITFILSWAYLAVQSNLNYSDLTFVVLSVITTLLNFHLLKGKGNKVENISIITMSITGKTLEAASSFAEGANKIEGVKASIINYSESGMPENISADAIVVAFPVHLMGMNRYFLWDIIKKLPRGQGRPAFLIYTAGIYADMAALIPWLIISIKGYSVKGRIWETTTPYKRLRYGGVMKNEELNTLSECGGDFADGWYSGMPLIIFPSPLFILSFITRKPK